MKNWFELVMEEDYQVYFVMGKVDGKPYKSKSYKDKADAEELMKSMKEKHGGMFTIGRQKAFV